MSTLPHESYKGLCLTDQSESPRAGLCHNIAHKPSNNCFQKTISLTQESPRKVNASGLALEFRCCREPTPTIRIQLQLLCKALENLSSSVWLRFPQLNLINQGECVDPLCCPASRGILQEGFTVHMFILGSSQTQKPTISKILLI